MFRLYTAVAISKGKARTTIRKNTIITECQTAKQEEWEEKTKLSKCEPPIKNSAIDASDRQSVSSVRRGRDTFSRQHRGRKNHQRK